VLAAISELGYQVNVTARSLRQGRTGVIGLAIPEVDRPYFGMLSGIVIERAAERGYDVVIEQTGLQRVGEMAAIHHSRLRSYDGLLLHATYLADEDAALLRTDYPIVVFGERMYAAPVDHVVMANEEGGMLAARHLLASGCRHPVMIGGRHWSGPLEAGSIRARGFVRELDASGMAVDPPPLFDVGFNPDTGREAVHRIFGEGGVVDGIFCATDYLAFGVLRGLADLGLRVPEDVCVIGFDDVPMAEFTMPSLSSISPNHTAMADAALDLIVGRINGTRAPGEYQEIVSEISVVARESTAR
jgi:DNA-binding LacI/PurR family transcriptional regulator